MVDYSNLAICKVFYSFYTLYQSRMLKLEEIFTKTFYCAIISMVFVFFIILAIGSFAKERLSLKSLPLSAETFKINIYIMKNKLKFSVVNFFKK